MPRSLILICCSLLPLLGACASTVKQHEPARPPASRISVEEGKKKQQALERARRRAQVDAITKVVAEVRGLRLKRQLKVGWIGAKDVKAKARQAIERELGQAYLDGYTEAFSRLGLLPTGYPYVEAMLEILGEQVAGYYDPDAQELFVRHDMPADEIVLAHEIAHALQDQHFNLKKLQGDVKLNEDRNFAVTALIEGDATQVMESYMVKTLNMWRAVKLLGSALRLATMDNAKLDAAPLFIQEGMMRPYLDGWALVKRLRALGGQAATDRAFKRPPVSSEQVLHPEKYLAQEAPVEVLAPDLGPALGPGWAVVHENSLGEFGVSMILRQARLPAKVIGPAARGWGGDRFRMYGHQASGRKVLLWKTAWDSVQDAGEFVEAYRAAVGGAAQASATGQIRRERRLIRWRWRGKQVEILDADITDEEATRLLGP